MKKIICLIIVLLLTTVTSCTAYNGDNVVSLEIVKNNKELTEMEQKLLEKGFKIIFLFPFHQTYR